MLIFVLVGMDLDHLQSKFFFCILKKGILAGKNLLFKRMKLFCKEGFSGGN
jgi:hypothetical protein